jgi:hypothetical protein
VLACWLQGLWIATANQLVTFMASPIWPKAGALAFKFKPCMNASWGYPERASSLAVLGGLAPVPPRRASGPSSCMLPYFPAAEGRPALLSPHARSDHLPNKYVQRGANWEVSLSLDSYSLTDTHPVNNSMPCWSGGPEASLG